MNWILTIPCLLILFIFYYLAGAFLLPKIGYNNKSNSLKIISGFFIMHFIGFLVGFPCQYFQLSWNLFFIILTFVYAGVLIFLLYYFKTIIKHNFQNIKQNWKTMAKEHFINNWFIYVLVIVFSLFSMTNQMAYYYGNYDDPYYIGKIINQVGAPILSAENYANGTLLPNNVTYSIVRSANSFEIIYGYFATLFNISIPFFCRATMVIHNYALMFIVYRSFAAMFVEKRNAQYTLIVFTLFLLSNGYLTEGWLNIPFKFRIFDSWQMQTAIFYGGSVVRTLAIPVLILFGKDLIEKLEIKKIGFIFIISIAFISFSTIYIQPALLLGYAFVIVKCLRLLQLNYKKWNINATLSLVVLLIMVIGLFLSVKASNLSILNADSALSTKNSFLSYHEFLIQNDVIMSMGFVFLIALFIITKNIIYRYIIIALSVLYLLMVSDMFVNLLTVTSFNYFFVSLRTIAAIQYMLMLIFAIVIIWFIQKIKFSRWIISIGTSAVLSFMLIFVLTHIDKMGSYDYDGAGLDRDGYSLSRLIENDKMIPELITEAGKYFDTLPYGNYSILTPASIPYEGTRINRRVVLMSSNRVEICIGNGCNYILGDDNYKQKGEEFFKGKIPFYEINSLFEKYQINYIFIYNEHQKEEVLEAGKEIVMEYTKDDITYYLVKLR